MHAFLKWRQQHKKPVLIGEAGVPQSYSPAQRAKWFRQFLSLSERRTGIRGIAYFDHVTPGTPPSHNVSLGGDPTVVAGLRRLTTSAQFKFSTRDDPIR